MIRFFLLLGTMLLCSCNLSDDLLTTMPPPSIPTLTHNIPTPPPEPTVAQQINNGWAIIAPGLEQRKYQAGPDDRTEILAVRVDPAQYQFRAHYRPGAPLSLREWRDLLPEALVFINANFFDVDYNITGLLVADSQIYGSAYFDRGGMFAVQNGLPRVRSNIYEPFAGEVLQQAVQAFPMLVLNGAQAYTSTAPDRTTRRTAIGQDALGRIILLATVERGITLFDLSAFLAESDMDMVNAFNLDGGGSTMIKAADGFALHAFDAVPAVLAVYTR